jgi:ArsR family metal-binding transcriptional regulator
MPTDSNLIPKSIEWNLPLEPMPVYKLDNDFKKALEKMAKIEEIAQSLPGINCGACGAPSCRVLAEDIVNHMAKYEDCIIIKKKKEEAT